jgi:ribonucleoside-diphosphate reductase alpha chain
MALVPQHASIGIRRTFTAEGVHPYDLVEWEERDARIVDWRTGAVAFEQLGVEVPTSWSVNATNILAQKYFRGQPGTSGRERSLKQVVDRIVDTIAAWGERDGYFADREESAAFRDELKYLMVTQKVAFNSPVWFNIGVPGARAQSSACFILAVDDTMESILNWYVEEGRIFKGGSGAGVNLSKIRASTEHLAGGGTASGPVSFMRGADASAGTIKSGGTTRRAAKMVILDADHPDIEDFIWCKAVEERKARALRDAGFDMDLDGKDSHSIQYQNANNSVRLTDQFMQAVLDDGDWHLRARLDGSVVKTVKARALLRQISEAAWECADPGLQFDTTINNWHTVPNSGRITGSNPCFPGDALVHTDKGLIRFDELFRRANEGEVFGVYTHDATNPDHPEQRVEITTPSALMITGYKDIVRLRFDNGMQLRCTPNHRIFTTNRGWVEARELTPEDRVKTLDVPAPAVVADYRLPVPSDVAWYAPKGTHKREVRLPEKWTPEFAHYLGWLVGDGCTSGTVVSTIYGTAIEQAALLPSHRDLIEWVNGDRSMTPSRQANGTVQLRISRKVFKGFVEALGVRSVTSAHKIVPWSIEQAPSDIVAAFLQGLFDAEGCAVRNDAKGSYVGLGSTSIELLRGAQRSLLTLGVTSRIYMVRKAAKASGFRYTRRDGTEVTYGQSASYDLRITARSLDRFAATVGFRHPSKADLLDEILAARSSYEVDRSARLVERTDDGHELTYDLTERRNHSFIVNGVVVSNCSEYLSLDNSACNLASINLLTFLHDADEGVEGFDIEAFKAAVEVTFTAQEILIGNSEYPTDKIGDVTRAFRQIGLGFTNLGALLMALGLPYDSDEGRAMAGTVTALMTGQAYLTSARIASRMGPFAGYVDNREPTLRVLEMHRDAAAKIDEELVSADLLGAAQCAWDDACELAREVGVRNSQCVVLAPTGTISFVLDADTTGVEPDLGLVKTKKMVGGGSMSIVNQTVPRALRRLGYTPEQVTEIDDYIVEHHSIVGAPHLEPEHLAVFACSMGDNTIHYRGHLGMLAAVQPFLSGAASKTINVPEETTVDEIDALHIEAWQAGIKCVAVYRDNSKVGQPLSLTKKAATTPVVEHLVPDAIQHGHQIVERIIERVSHEPVRRKLPRTRVSRTFEFRVADCKGFVTVGEYEDGRPGEIFVRVSKQGSTLAGIMDAFAISISHGLQYGVPLRAFVEAFVGMRFEPAGMTDDPDIRIASSLLDYLFRRLAVEYLPATERTELNILTTGERTQPTLPGVEEAATETRMGGDVTPDPPSSRHNPSIDLRPPSAELVLDHDRAAADAPLCMTCGIHMQRAGSCYVCPDCGTTSGCS